MDRRRSIAIGVVRRAAASTIERHQTKSWSYKTAGTVEKQKCFERALHRKEFVTTWSMRSNSWQTSKKDGDSPVKMVVTGLSREKSTQNDAWAQKVRHGRQP